MGGAVYGGVLHVTHAVLELLLLCTLLFALYGTSSMSAAYAVARSAASSTLACSLFSPAALLVPTAACAMSATLSCGALCWARRSTKHQPPSAVLHALIAHSGVSFISTLAAGGWAAGLLWRTNGGGASGGGTSPSVFQAAGAGVAILTALMRLSVAVFSGRAAQKVSTIRKPPLASLDSTAAAQPWMAVAGVWPPDPPHHYGGTSSASPAVLVVRPPLISKPASHDGSHGSGGSGGGVGGSGSSGGRKAPHLDEAYRARYCPTCGTARVPGAELCAHCCRSSSVSSQQDGFSVTAFAGGEAGNGVVGGRLGTGGFVSAATASSRYSVDSI